MDLCLVSMRKRKTLSNKWEGEEFDVPTETKLGEEKKDQEGLTPMARDD